MVSTLPRNVHWRGPSCSMSRLLLGLALLCYCRCVTPLWNRHVAFSIKIDPPALVTYITAPGTGRWVAVQLRDFLVV